MSSFRCFVLSKQILLGYEGTELTDPVKTFIHSFYDYFRGGVFWISCRSEEVVAACVKKVLEVCVYVCACACERVCVWFLTCLAIFTGY